MKPMTTRFITISALLTGASFASAHEENTAATVYHYLSSPDHLALFALLAAASIFTGLYLARFKPKLIKLKKK